MKLSFPFQWLSDFGRVLQGNPRGSGTPFVRCRSASRTDGHFLNMLDGFPWTFPPILSFSPTCFRKGSAGLLSLLEFPGKCIFFSPFSMLFFYFFYLFLISSSATTPGTSVTVAFARLIAFHGSTPLKKKKNKKKGDGIKYLRTRHGLQ